MRSIRNSGTVLQCDANERDKHDPLRLFVWLMAGIVLFSAVRLVDGWYCFVTREKWWRVVVDKRWCVRAWQGVAACLRRRFGRASPDREPEPPSHLLSPCSARWLSRVGRIRCGGPRCIERDGGRGGRRRRASAKTKGASRPLQGSKPPTPTPRAPPRLPTLVRAISCAALLLCSPRPRLPCASAPRTEQATKEKRTSASVAQ
jgi:hypothetical protein